VSWIRDADKALITSPKLGVNGRRLWFVGFQFECSSTALAAHDLIEGQAVSIASDFTVARLKADYTEASTAGETVITRVRYWPKFTYDIKGARIHLDHNAALPTEPVKIFAQLAPQIPASMGGQVCYIAGVDVRFHIEWEFDGVTTTTVTHIPEVPATEIEVQIHHPAGYAGKFLAVLELFR
jgi:hypothetical protein